MILAKANSSPPIKLAEFLEQNKKVDKVHYPGLKSNKYHKIATKQMRGYGGMFSFEVKGGLKNAKIVLENLNICTLGASLGGVESLIEMPGNTSHMNIPEEERKEIGIVPGFVRLSVGIENVDDLIADFSNALESN